MILRSQHFKSGCHIAGSGCDTWHQITAITYRKVWKACHLFVLLLEFGLCGSRRLSSHPLAGLTAQSANQPVEVEQIGRPLQQTWEK